MHTIHGRATAVASGLKMTSTDLRVWVVIGDGDSLRIDAGPFKHMIRRHPDLNELCLHQPL